jgi:anti-sigma factor RsiW
MTCEIAGTLVEALLDGELDAARQAEVREHLNGCEACAAELARVNQLREEMREYLPAYRAPEELRRRVLGALPKPKSRSFFQWRWLAAPAFAALVCSLALNIFFAVRGGRGADSLAQEVFAEHVRSTLGSRLIDVESSDRHTVKPWFVGKLDFSPEVKDLSVDGYPLAGGRVDYLGGRSVAALVFRRGGHVISVFEWPGSERESAGSWNGLNLRRWSKDGMSFWAVSDVNSDDLYRFEQIYRR